MKIIIGDADALIALTVSRDAHHKRAVEINSNLTKSGVTIIFPNTAILEAVTSLKRALNLSDEAHRINVEYLKGNLLVEYVEEEIQQRAGEIFRQTKSKKNTMFDAVVAATAGKLGAEAIFSFDGWYRKLGFHLVGE